MVERDAILVPLRGVGTGTLAEGLSKRLAEEWMMGVGRGANEAVAMRSAESNY